MENDQQPYLEMSVFVDNVPECSPTIDETGLPFNYDFFLEMIMETVYIIDFHRQSVRYMANHGLFLTECNSKNVMDQGYEFFSKIIHPEDLPLWIQIYNTMLTYLHSPGISVDSINYFSCTFRVRSGFDPGNKPYYLMVYQKLKPIFVNGLLRFGLCVLSDSVIPASGNLRIHYRDNTNYEEYYSFVTNRWKAQKIEPLSERQKMILLLAKQGKKAKEMADIMCLSVPNINKERIALLEKFGVRNIKEAVIYVMNRRLIVDSIPEISQCTDKQQPVKVKRRRRIMTPDVLARIQNGLDNDQSINSLAKKERFSVTAICKAIKQERLHKREGNL